MSGRIGNLIVALILLVFPAVLLLLAEFYWDYAPNVILFPLITGCLLLLCAIWLAVRALVVPVDVLSAEGESVGVTDDPRASLLKRILWMAVVYPLCYFMGMIAGLITLSVVYTSYHRLPWWQRLLSAVIVFMIVYVGFYKLLGVSLPVSPLWMRE
jgi:hypothetical protein